jgi:hypothetical protein
MHRCLHPWQVPDGEKQDGEKPNLGIVKYLAGEKAASVDAAQEDGGTALLSAARVYQHVHLQFKIGKWSGFGSPKLEGCCPASLWGISCSD